MLDLAWLASTHSTGSTNSWRGLRCVEPPFRIAGNHARMKNWRFFLLTTSLDPQQWWPDPQLWWPDPQLWWPDPQRGKGVTALDEMA